MKLVPFSQLRVPAEQLRWMCDTSTLNFQTTAEVEPLAVFVGQSDAVESLEYGLDHFAPGQNVFVRGSVGTGRLTLVERLLEDVKPECERSPDLVYVRNFETASRPRLLSFPTGKGRAFVRRMAAWVEYASKGLSAALEGEAFRKRTEAATKSVEAGLDKIRLPFEEVLKENDLALMSVPAGDAMRTVLLPIIDGEPAPPEKIHALKGEGKLSDEDLEAIRAKIEVYARQLQDVGSKLQKAQQEGQTSLRELVQSEIHALLTAATQSTRETFTDEKVAQHLDQCVDDLAERGVPPADVDKSFWRRYEANLVHTCQGPKAPAIFENSPSQSNLVGTIERKLLPGGEVISDHLMITGGAILRANGGYLVLDARDLLTEPGAWRSLVRTLRSGKLEIDQGQRMPGMGAAGMQPEPIPVSVKVVLIGDAGIYYMLDQKDPDFRNLFKVLADFDEELELSTQSVGDYSRFIARLSRDEKMLPFHATGVGKLAEHGARIAGRNDRLTARFGRLIDLAREAAYLAKRDGAEAVEGRHVRNAVKRTRRRADLPARRFRARISDGTVNVMTDGEAVGQINGLAVLSAGPLTFGFPSRITSTIGAGTSGMINIEGEASLSGSIHTKGFYILGGLLRQLLPTAHPLAFSASIAFEQSYGGIDGDSASGAEMCCLLSALTGFPLRQDLAMTGAIDQHGNIQAIGAVSEKIEGFFDTCSDRGLTGEQGCLIPAANVKNLMLREDVVAACEAGQFHVYAVSRIEQALEVLTGIAAGEIDPDDGLYPEDTVLGQALDRAFQFWTLASAHPSAGLFGDSSEELEEPEA